MHCSGAGNSEGKTSWTAKPELADYASFYGFMLCYLRSLRSRLASQRRDKSTTDEHGADVESPLGFVDIHLILGGYSYGSLIASHLPALDAIVDLFRNSIEGAPSFEIFQTAENVSALLEENGPTQEQRPSARGALLWSLDASKIAVSYLLVSPLLPPLNLFLTLFSTMSLDVGIYGATQGKQILCPKTTSQLCAHPSLAIYGNQDTFTSANKLNKWSDELSHVPGSQFQSAEIAGAGHFWREEGVESQARDALRDWLRLIP
jgi:pimeloyl-ACP methyl ester carboxylesterase